MDAINRFVAGAALARLEAPRELRVDRVRQPLDLFRRELRRQRERRQAGHVEDLVRPRAPDPGEQALVAQKRVQAARVAGEDRAQPLRPEPERIGPQVLDLRLGSLRRQEPRPGPFLRPALGHHESPAALEFHLERRRLRPLLARREVLDPPRAHHVEQQDELPVVGREEQPLPAPHRAREPPSLEHAQGRVEGLQRRDVRRPCANDRERRNWVVERPPERLNLWKFGHVTSCAMDPPISVLVRRGPTVESVHRVHAAASRDGEVVASAGDPDLVTFMRSSAKPIQALPLAREYPSLPTDELAIACASHLADRAQLAAVESLLARAHAREEDLECGAEGDPPSRLNHNCSGKHAGMLAVCRTRGWPTEGYRLGDHPLQQALHAEIETTAGATPSATAVDGCGVVTFALPLHAMAHAFTRLEDRITEAMRAHPELIRGERAADTMLMRTLPGWVAEDGAARALRPALAAFLGRLGHVLPEAFAVVGVENSRGERVGEIVAAL